MLNCRIAGGNGSHLPGPRENTKEGVSSPASEPSGCLECTISGLTAWDWMCKYYPTAGGSPENSWWILQLRAPTKTISWCFCVTVTPKTSSSQWNNRVFWHRFCPHRQICRRLAVPHLPFLPFQGVGLHRSRGWRAFRALWWDRTETEGTLRAGVCARPRLETRHTGFITWHFITWHKWFKQVTGTLDSKNYSVFLLSVAVASIKMFF